MANNKRVAAKRATGDKATNMTKASSGQGMGKGKVSAAPMTTAKATSLKRKRSAPIMNGGEDDCETDDEANQESQDNQDNQDFSGPRDLEWEEYIEAAAIRAANRTGIVLGEEFYGFEDDYDDEDMSHIPPNSEQRRRNGRLTGRDLIIWNRAYMDAKLLLTIQYECARHNIDIPWDAVAHRLHPGSSGSAILQHLARLRNTVFLNGHLVPPDLPKSNGARDPSHYTMRGFYRMPQNVRWSEGEPLFAAKRAITFKEKFEHSAHKYRDVFCLPFDPDSALEDGILVDANNQVLRQNNRKIPKSKVKVGSAPHKKRMAKDTSSTTDFAPPSKPTTKKKTLAKKAATSSSPANLPSENELTPVRTTHRRSSRVKRVKTYHEADYEEDDNEHSDILEACEAEASVPVSAHNSPATPGSETSFNPGQASDEDAADQEKEYAAETSSPQNELPNTYDVLGIYGDNDAQDGQDGQDTVDAISNGDGSSSDDEEEPNSLIKLLSDQVDFQDQATAALDLVAEQRMAQEHQVANLLQLNPQFFGHYGSQVPNLAMSQLYPPTLPQFAPFNNDGTISSTSSPPLFPGHVAVDNAGMNSMHAPPMVSAMLQHNTLLSSFGAEQHTPMASMAGGFTPLGMREGNDGAAYFNKVVDTGAQYNNQFLNHRYHDTYDYPNTGVANPHGR
ncbi:uncharacterized protein SPSK_01492 [Sporothrix schenckii 1099-18]|uniref:Uncharacterized protein n=1 Tax=Sporothrix schenckii 1099-18 TaxID=1397361 RepID=A0A0F2MER3_SPOSC|nr:uncharacterized protein SPSK_01492 [Sporothrix schenckii 1099-18]KJR87345.1 hypothetical protein SPSK_01492 [Sporothrix schenckii 1099-18]